jgi:hypothetical protein
VDLHWLFDDQVVWPSDGGAIGRDAPYQELLRTSSGHPFRLRRMLIVGIMR